jgi:hypothetical protein
MSEIELALVKPVGVSKKFRLLDVVASSHELHATDVATTHTARVPTFDNLSDDSLPDVRETPLSEKMIEKRTSPPPSISGEFLCFSFALFTMGPDDCFFRSCSACPPCQSCHWRI